MTKWVIGFQASFERADLYKAEGEQLESLGHFTLAEIASQVLDAGVLGFVQTESVLFVEATLPKTSEKRLRLALPALVEESIASAPEDNFYALPATYHPEQACQVAIINHAYLESLINACKEATIHLLSLTPDCFLLPEPQEGVMKMTQGNRVVVRSGKNQGFSMAKEYALLILSELESLPEQAPRLTEPLPFNFLQGEFLPKAPKKPLGKQQYLYIGVGGVFAVHLLSLGIMGSVLKHRLSHLQEQSLALYAQAFPGAEKVTSAKTLIERELAHYGAQAADPFQGLVAELSHSLEPMAGADLQRLEYGQGRLSVGMVLPNLDALETLTRAKEKQITEQENKVSVQFSLAAGESR